MSGEKTTQEKIRILLADDHDLLRQGLKLLFEAQPDMQVVGEARNGREAIEQTSEHAPDVVIMDISMAEMDGLEACQRIRKLHPGVQVLILTMHESEEYFLQALRIGAAGYLVKKAAPTELSTAVRTLAQGGAYLYPGLAKTLIRAYISTHNQSYAYINSQKSGKEKNSSLGHALDVLTPREVEVLKYVAEGKTNQEIADMLVISIKTVQAHRANVMDKLGLHDITHLVRFAIHHGLIAAEPYL
ncbi:response regulator transcription factor [Dictyobacter kobayashii]|uniref:DNA-binding response regulator n=1 Tax=Dictyobacter kobayashii TaxID=2014872 RepID=A0A402API0_9CHLR|nr:response regulator transcription factor [Dictyobacter kobayashii]GCE21088.1 DNA-binding response regulator [Dictyobacter kobayashii]